MRFKKDIQDKERAQVVTRGRALLQAHGQQKEAVEFLSAAVIQFPLDPEIRVLYASILLASQPDNVALEATRAAELGQDDPVTLVQAASLLLDRLEIESARAAVIRARELAGPDFVLMSGLVNLEGLLAALDGNDQVAEDKLRLAVEIAPAYSAFAGDLARYLRGRGRQEDAIEVIDTALQHVKQKGELRRLRAELVAS